jgi:hypothetical protein
MKLQQDHHQRGGDVEGEARAASFHGCMCVSVCVTAPSEQSLLGNGRRIY